MRQEAETWWRQAQADLETARVTLAADRHYAASWFAQQAVEKGLNAALRQFARQLHTDLDASRVLLFGSRARGKEHSDSDYDLIIVSPRFSDIEPMRRAVGLRQIWYRVGGNGPMDLLCLTPREFADAGRRISLIAAVLPEAIDLLPVERTVRA